MPNDRTRADSFLAEEHADLFCGEDPVEDSERGSGAPATPLSTTAQLSVAVENDLMTDVMLPDHIVQIVEQNSAKTDR
jgi:hypothetical protein